MRQHNVVGVVVVAQDVVVVAQNVVVEIVGWQQRHSCLIVWVTVGFEWRA